MVAAKGVDPSNTFGYEPRLVPTSPQQNLGGDAIFPDIPTFHLQLLTTLVEMQKLTERLQVSFALLVYLPLLGIAYTEFRVQLPCA